MAARLKSSVLRREEKGVGSISMARLMLAGMGGGVVFMGMQLLGIPLLMIPAGLVAFILGLILTAPRHGIPLYLHLKLTLLTRLMLAARLDETSIEAKVISLLGMKLENLTLDTAEVLSASVILEDEGSLDAWEILPDTVHETGFELVSDV